MARLLGRLLLAFLIGAATLFAGDWAVWRVRVAMGGGVGHMEVSRIQVVPLKGNKEEYYSDGTAEVDCSRSIFPQAGAGACWWLTRHYVIFER
jgi:hypothetical protein